MKYRYSLKDDSPAKMGLQLCKMCRDISTLSPVPTVVCVGTDRSTGDSLGPLTGWLLQRRRLNTRVLGSLSRPIHASNLSEFVQQFTPKGPTVAIDACLGSRQHVGTISLCEGPLRPGAGVKKDLPEIGDVHIAGTVNTSGFMEYYVLQNTRLNLVMSMAGWIARGICAAVRHLSKGSVESAESFCTKKLVAYRLRSKEAAPTSPQTRETDK